MTEARDPLFRDEALAYLARHQGPGEVLRVAEVWLDAVYWAFLVLVAIGALASLLIPIDGEPLLYVLVPALSNLHG